MLFLPYSPPPSIRRRRGFTLIELLVVIAIIAVLIGLLLPAVQKVRESAARTKCQNNLKQVALGCHLYHDTYKVLPSGLVGGAGTPNKLGWTWATLILPYIEQKNVFDAAAGINGAKVAVTPGIQKDLPSYPAGIAPPLTNAKISIFRCPSDASPDQNQNFDGLSTTNYVCNREVLGPGRKGGATPAELLLENPLTLGAPLKDGTSNTILLGEREGDQNVAATWAFSAVTTNTTASFEGRPGPKLNPDPQKDISPAKAAWAPGDAAAYAYGSNHTGGSQFAMCDGRVIFISDQVGRNSADSYTNFPCAYGLNAGHTLQYLQCPIDRQVVSID